MGCVLRGAAPCAQSLAAPAAVPSPFASEVFALKPTKCQYPRLHGSSWVFATLEHQAKPFKEGRGWRAEATFPNPKDFDINKGLANLPNLRKTAVR